MLGRRISHFYVIRALGSGGMGVVYEAQDTRLPRSVAIKFLNPGLGRDVDAIRRFKREARLASSLNHPNICTILDVDEGDGQPFIAMELLHGRNLKARLADALGTILAHEVGHVLLRGRPHAATGLMRAVCDARQIRGVMLGTTEFTPEEAILIRRGLF